MANKPNRLSKLLTPEFERRAANGMRRLGLTPLPGKTPGQTLLAYAVAIANHKDPYLSSDEGIRGLVEWTRGAYGDEHEIRQILTSVRQEQLAESVSSRLEQGDTEKGRPAAPPAKGDHTARDRESRRDLIARKLDQAAPTKPRVLGSGLAFEIDRAMAKHTGETSPARLTEHAEQEVEEADALDQPKGTMRDDVKAAMAKVGNEG